MPAPSGRGMTAVRPAPNQQVVPRPRSSAGRSGRFDFWRHGGDRDPPDHDKRADGAGLPAGRGRAAHLSALAGCRCLRAGRRRQPRGLVQAAIRDHPAAAQHHRLAPHGPRADPDGRGPHDPPRPDAGPPDACGCPASTTPRSPPRWCSIGSSPRRARRAHSLGRERYLERMWLFINETRDLIGQQQPAGRCRSTGAGCASRWTRARPAPCGSPSSGCTTTASPIAASSSSTGARATRPACPIWR